MHRMVAVSNEMLEEVAETVETTLDRKGPEGYDPTVGNGA